MKITKTTTHEITFQVSTYWATEGGMEQDNFGEIVKTLEEAIHNLEVARSQNSSLDWFIETRVNTVVK